MSLARTSRAAFEAFVVESDRGQLQRYLLDRMVTRMFSLCSCSEAAAPAMAAILRDLVGGGTVKELRQVLLEDLQPNVAVHGILRTPCSVSDQAPRNRSAHRLPLLCATVAAHPASMRDCQTRSARKTLAIVGVVTPVVCLHAVVLVGMG
jgi:hypothetical protein